MKRVPRQVWRLVRTPERRPGRVVVVGDLRYPKRRIGHGATLGDGHLLSLRDRGNHLLHGGEGSGTRQLLRVAPGDRQETPPGEASCGRVSG